MQLIGDMNTAPFGPHPRGFTFKQIAFTALKLNRKINDEKIVDAFGSLIAEKKVPPLRTPPLL